MRTPRVDAWGHHESMHEDKSPCMRTPRVHAWEHHESMHEDTMSPCMRTPWVHAWGHESMHEDTMSPCMRTPRVHKNTRSSQRHHLRILRQCWTSNVWHCLCLHTPNLTLAASLASWTWCALSGSWPLRSWWDLDRAAENTHDQWREGRQELEICLTPAVMVWDFEQGLDICLTPAVMLWDFEQGLEICLTPAVMVWDFEQGLRDMFDTCSHGVRLGARTWDLSDTCGQWYENLARDSENSHGQ